jgi:hypothetical protein
MFHTHIVNSDFGRSTPEIFRASDMRVERWRHGPGDIQKARLASTCWVNKYGHRQNDTNRYYSIDGLSSLYKSLPAWHRLLMLRGSEKIMGTGGENLGSYGLGSEEMGA